MASLYGVASFFSDFFLLLRGANERRKTTLENVMREGEYDTGLCKGVKILALFYFHSASKHADMPHSFFNIRDQGI